jgi:hypothetical protein
MASFGTCGMHLPFMRDYGVLDLKEIKMNGIDVIFTVGYCHVVIVPDLRKRGYGL